MPYREDWVEGPRPPKRGNFTETCPHGYFSKWQWCCDRCQEQIVHQQSAVLKVWLPRIGIGIWLACLYGLIYILATNLH